MPPLLSEAQVKRFWDKAKKENKDIHEVIAAGIAKSNELDGWLASINDVKHVDMDNLGRVLAIHRQFIELLKKLTGGERATRRSFASKYLHFHNPNAFFIFDTRAESEIRCRCKELPRSTKVKSSQLPLSRSKYDGDCADFVLR